MFKIEIDTAALEKLSDDLQQFSKQIADITPLAQPVEQIIFAGNEEQVLSQGARGNTPYDGLSPEYAEDKEKQYPGKPINVRTGALLAALTGVDGNNSITVTNTAIEFSIDLLYAIYVQEQRPVVAPTKQDVEAMGEAIADNAMALFQRIFG